MSRRGLQAQSNSIFAVPYSQVLTGGAIFPSGAIADGLLTNGPKRYRVLVGLDAGGRLNPTAMVVDNRRRTVTHVPTGSLDRLAGHVATTEQAEQLRRWAATFRAEQAGLGGGVH